MASTDRPLNACGCAGCTCTRLARPTWPTRCLEAYPRTPTDVRKLIVAADCALKFNRIDYVDVYYVLLTFMVVLFFNTLRTGHEMSRFEQVERCERVTRYLGFMVSSIQSATMQPRRMSDWSATREISFRAGCVLCIVDIYGCFIF